MTYAGGGTTPIFSFVPPPRRAARVEERFGWVSMPEQIWLDITRFDHWIEDSVVLRWARLTARMNRADEAGAGHYLGMLLQTPGAERTTSEARALLRATGAPVCVWTGVRLSEQFHIDHAVPYTVWGNNDLWNLLPAARQVNLQKGDRLPTHALLIDRADAIAQCWRAYRVAAPGRFEAQISRALGCDPARAGWEDRALAGLQETVERLAIARGLARWQP